MTQKIQKPPATKCKTLDCAMHTVDPQIDGFKQARRGMEKLRNEVHDRIDKGDINRAIIISIQL